MAEGGQFSWNLQQNAQKTLENEMSKLKLKEIVDFCEAYCQNE